MSELEIVSAGYRELFGSGLIEISALQQSGSDRKYFRIYDNERNVIASYNSNYEENEAFIGFTKHFQSKGLKVPEIYGYLPDKSVYYLQDLGDTNLYLWLQEKHYIDSFPAEAEEMYRRILDNLTDFQIKGIDGLNLDLCYPHRSFDRQSMMWDMNYFKYMFLKLLAVGFNEKRLEHDFNVLADFLLSTGQDYFLYRDFQSANMMIVRNEPWFIDYQGGRKGAPQYDVASLLYDAKAHIPFDTRQRLLDYHVQNFCRLTGESVPDYLGFYAGFSIIRLLQALGAFGFRGLYEKKPTFTASIVPAVRLLTELIDVGKLPVSLPDLVATIHSIPSATMFKTLENGKHSG